MKSAAESLPNDLDELKEMVLQQQAKLDHQSDYIHQLIEAIKLARHQHFGTRSEKFNTEQLSLLFNEAEILADHESDEQDDDSEEETTTVGPYKRRKGGRKKLPDHYPRIDVVHVLEESDCHCDHCQGELAEMGEKVSEQIDLVPLTVRVIRNIRKTYHCPDCENGI